MKYRQNKPKRKKRARKNFAGIISLSTIVQHFSPSAWILLVFYLSGNSFRLCFSPPTPIYAGVQTIYNPKPNICTKCRRNKNISIRKLKTNRKKENTKTKQIVCTPRFRLVSTEKYVKHAKQSIVSHLMPHLIRIQRHSPLTSPYYTNKTQTRVRKTTMKYNHFNPSHFTHFS